MELDDMKQMWQKMDDVLNQQKILNDKMIDHLITQRSYKPLNTIKIAEYLNIYTSIAFFIALLFAIPRLGNSALIIGCYVFIMLALALTAVFSQKNVNTIKRLDKNFGTLPVTELIKQTERLKLTIKKYQMIVIIGGPIAMAAAYAMMQQVVHGNFSYDIAISLSPRLGIATVVYFIIVIGVYQSYYFKNIRIIQNNLREAERFSSSG